LERGKTVSDPSIVILPDRGPLALSHAARVLATAKTRRNGYERNLRSAMILLLSR
jgi:hypothetical protein